VSRESEMPLKFGAKLRCAPMRDWLGAAKRGLHAAAAAAERILLRGCLLSALVNLLRVSLIFFRVLCCFA
jgi:hypothetical protein